MPLPPLPAHLTPRYRLNYSANNVLHSINVHLATPTSSSAALTAATALANLLKILCYASTSFTSVDYAEAGSDVFNQIGTLAIVGTLAGTTAAADNPRQGSFAGRSTSGRKTRLFIYGIAGGVDASYRFTRAEWPAVGTVVDGLNAGTGAIAAIDGSTTLAWKNYMNVGYNDRYVKKARRAG